MAIEEVKPETLYTPTSRLWKIGQAPKRNSSSKHSFSEQTNVSFREGRSKHDHQKSCKARPMLSSRRPLQRPLPHRRRNRRHWWRFRSIPCRFWCNLAMRRLKGAKHTVYQPIHWFLGYGFGLNCMDMGSMQLHHFRCIEKHCHESYGSLVPPEYADTAPVWWIYSVANSHNRKSKPPFLRLILQVTNLLRTHISSPLWQLDQWVSLFPSWSNMGSLNYWA